MYRWRIGATIAEHRDATLAPGAGAIFVCGPAGDTCAVRIDVEIETAGVYTAEVIAWSDGYDERFGDDGYARLGLAATLYQEGDTWYRDMRTPGFGGELAPKGVGQPAVAGAGDRGRPHASPRRRSSSGGQRSWGREVAEPPAEEGDADFEAELLSANAQNAEVDRLAQGFRQGFRFGAPYNLKDLLVEMVLSKWFRADALNDGGPGARGGAARCRCSPPIDAGGTGAQDCRPDWISVGPAHQNRLQGQIVLLSPTASIENSGYFTAASTLTGSPSARAMSRP